MVYKYFVFFLLITACQNSPQIDDKKSEVVVLSPEETIKKFQGYIDNNDFTNAIEMSTSDMEEVLSSLSNLFNDDSDESGITQTTFLQTNCMTKENTAVCNCRLRDEYEDYSSMFFLKKIKGKWLIDRTEDSYSDEDEEMKIFDTEKK